MSDRYVHSAPDRLTVSDQENLVALARYLVLQSAAIEKVGGLTFGHVDMIEFDPLPAQIRSVASGPLPPLAHAPLAGILPQQGEDWPAYLLRVFGICSGSTFMHWLQSSLWSKTEPSAIGTGLRIAYVLDYGLPHDYVEIAMGQAYTDYDSNGFLWERIGLLPVKDANSDLAPKKIWPNWIGAVEQNRLRSEVIYNAGNLVPSLIENGIARPDEIEGCPTTEIEALERELGSMPQSYRDVLALIGRRSGNLVDRSELQIHADQLGQVNRMARERIFGVPEPGDAPVPHDAVFIGARCGEHPWFILSGRRVDSPVFQFDSDTGRVTHAGVSVWSWVEALVDMRPNIRLRPEERQTVNKLLVISNEISARLAATSVPITTRVLSRRASAWLVIAGGAVLVAGSLAYIGWSTLGY